MKKIDSSLTIGSTRTLLTTFYQRQQQGNEPESLDPSPLIQLLGLLLYGKQRQTHTQEALKAFL